LTLTYTTPDSGLTYTQSEYKHSLTFCVRDTLSWQRNPCTDFANPPNSAQLEGTPTIPASYIRVRAVVWECGEGKTDEQTHRRA